MLKSFESLNNKEGENRLLQEAYWSFIEKSMPLALYRTTGDLKRKLLFCNNHFLTLLNLQEDYGFGFQGKNSILLQDLVPAEDKDTVDFRIHEAIRYKKSYHNECRLIKKDGSVIWVIDKGDIELNEEGEIICLNGFLQDITYLKTISTGQVAEDEWFLQTIKNCADGIWDWTTVTNSPKISGKFKKLLGYEETDPIGESVEWFLENVHQEDFGPFSQYMTNYIDKPEGEFSYEIRILTKQKTYATVILKALSQTDAQGRVFRIAGQIVDITSYRNLQHELEEMRNQTLKISEAKSKFIASLNHDLRGPLTGIIGLTNLLKEKVTDHIAHKNVTIIADSASMLLNLVNDILDVSKIEAGKLDIDVKPASLRTCVTRIVEIVRPQTTDKEISLNLMYDPKIPQILMFDEKRLQQILINLLTNAVKFTDFGYINLLISLSYTHQENVDIRFEVRDTGCGISEELKDILFDDFTQGHGASNRKNGGTGLGLSICKRLVELMGGNINFSSEEERGSTFWFTINLNLPEQSDLLNFAQPKKEGPPASFSMETDLKTSQEYPLKKAPPGEFSCPLRDSSGLNILLAEDNLINQEVMKGLLSKLGHQLTIAQNGQEAVDFFQNGSFDLILMDINMPIMDGIEATKKIRSLEKGVTIPILAVTANTLESENNACLDVGVNQVIHKPIDKKILQELLSPYVTIQDSKSPRPIPSPPTKSDSPLISLDTIKTLQEDLGVEKVLKLLDIYRRDTRLLIEKMNGAQTKEIHNLAHNLAGMSENLGILRMALHARNLMALCLKEAIYLPVPIKELQTTLEEVEVFIDSFSNNNFS